MRNLFIMHTQYNLILASGIAKNRFQNDENILILHAEFKLNEQLKKNIEDCFDNVYYVQQNFVPIEKVFKEDYKLIKYLNKTKKVWKQNFDNVFLSQERLYDTYLLSKISKHCKFKCYSIEEDAYFSVNNERNENVLREPKKTILGKIRKCVHNVVLGKNKFYRFGWFFGQSDIFDGNYVLFPDCVRGELKEHSLYEITKEELMCGIEVLYGHIEKLEVKTDKVVVFFFDLLERYKAPEIVKKFVKTLAEKCERNNITFIYKYHPRETEKIELASGKNWFEIPSIIPAEKVLYDFREKEVTVIGNLTTAVWVASKMEFKTHSVIRIENPENVVAAKAFESMGINLVNAFEKIEI